MYRYKIIAVFSEDNHEVIDECDNRDEAERYALEYEVAFNRPCYVAECC